MEKSKIGIVEVLLSLQDGKVRFLICTDVAARGIDVSGLPFGKFTNEL